MRASSMRSIAIAGLSLVALSGCGRMPTISSNVPNWPQSSGQTQEEVRAEREAELAKYKTTPQENTMTALASKVLGLGPSSPTPAARAARPEPSAVSTAATPAPAPAPAARFEVAPEQLRQPPPARQAPPRETLALAAPSASAAVPQAARYGDLVFISGQRPVDARGQPVAADARFEDQARLALDSVRSVLESNRLSMANVVSMTVYLRDLNDMRAFEAVYANYFKGAQPARSVVEVSRLPNNARIEISAVAGR